MHLPADLGLLAFSPSRFDQISTPWGMSTGSREAQFEAENSVERFTGHRSFMLVQVPQRTKAKP